MVVYVQNLRLAEATQLARGVDPRVSGFGGRRGIELEGEAGAGPGGPRRPPASCRRTLA